MLRRSFTKFEKAFLLVLIVVLLSLVYYRFVHLPVKDRIAASDTYEIDLEIQAEQEKAEYIRSMQEEVDTNQDIKTGVVSTYDNFKAEAALLNSIFVPLAEKYNYSFETPVASNNTVRRAINISFTTANYKVCREIIQKLHDSKYRCAISDVSISATDKSSNSYLTILTSPINCTLSVTFYETLIGAVTTAGLDMSGQKQQDEYIGLGKADFSNLEHNSLETIAESIVDEHQLKY